MKRKAKRKAKAKAKPRPPSLATSLRALTRAIKAQDEQMRLWEMRIRGCLVQMAGVIAEQQDVPALLRKIAIQDVDLRSLRTRMGIRRSEYVQEKAPDGICQEQTTPETGLARYQALLDSLDDAWWQMSPEEQSRYTGLPVAPKPGRQELPHGIPEGENDLGWPVGTPPEVAAERNKG